MGGFDKAYADRQNVRGWIEEPEVRVKNDRTGGEKCAKKELYSLLPWPEIAELAHLYEAGASKYEKRNWEKGYDYSLSFDALMRHATAWWMGEETDPETKKSHMAAVAFHAFALMRFLNEYPELDDRPNTAKGQQNAKVQSVQE